MRNAHLLQTIKLLGLSCLCHQAWANPNKMFCFAPQRRDRRGSNSDTKTLQFFPIFKDWKELERLLMTERQLGLAFLMGE